MAKIKVPDDGLLPLDACANCCGDTELLQGEVRFRLSRDVRLVGEIDRPIVGITFGICRRCRPSLSRKPPDGALFVVALIVLSLVFGIGLAYLIGALGGQAGLGIPIGLVLALVVVSAISVWRMPPKTTPDAATRYHPVDIVETKWGTPRVQLASRAYAKLAKAEAKAKKRART